MEFLGSLSRASSSTFDGFDGVHQLLQDLGVVYLCSCKYHREGDATAVDQKVTFRASASTVYGIRTRLLAPF